MFVERPELFLRNFGKPCLAHGAQFLGLLDQPDAIQQMQRVKVHTREYELTYISEAVALSVGDSVSVNGSPYTVREAPRQLDDGVFSVALLTKD